MVGDGAPDLRNLFVHFCPCWEGDMLVLLSDGVHDNLDPVTRGLSPSDLGFNDESWATVKDEELLQRKSTYLRDQAEKLIHSLPVSPVTGLPAAQAVAHGLSHLPFASASLLIFQLSLR